MSSFRKKSVITTQVFLTLGILVMIASQFQNCAGAKFDQDTTEQGQGKPPEVETPVEEIFKSLKPAMAVRGIGCFTCHANINSSIITDVGYGNPFYRANDSVYSNFGFDQMNSFPSSNTVYIPKSNDNLERYLDSANTMTFERRDKIYIGAPSASVLRSAFGDASGMKYEKTSASSVELSGISGSGAKYVGSGSIACDGDLFIDGSLHLKDATIATNSGCRLYVTKAVFVSGGLRVQNSGGGSDHNVQITSAFGISMGLDAYLLESERFTPGLKFTADINTAFPMRGYANVTTYKNTLLAELNKFSGVTRAENDSVGRDIGFSRLLLNAPRIDSRYRGAVSGVIIAEIAMMAVNNFTYTYDPVFTRVKILPKIPNSTYLDVK